MTAWEHVRNDSLGACTERQPWSIVRPLRMSLRTGNVTQPTGRESSVSRHSPPCGMVPVQSMYGMTAWEYCQVSEDVIAYRECTQPTGRESSVSRHSPPCGMVPVQSMYGMTAEHANNFELTLSLCFLSSGYFTL